MGEGDGTLLAAVMVKEGNDEDGGDDGGGDFDDGDFELTVCTEWKRGKKLPSIQYMEKKSISSRHHGMFNIQYGSTSPKRASRSPSSRGKV